MATPRRTTPRAPKDGTQREPTPAQRVVEEHLRDTTQEPQNPDRSLGRLARIRRGITTRRPVPPPE